MVKGNKKLPIRDDKSILEDESRKFFLNALPPEWVTDIPRDYGIDFNVTTVVNNEVSGINFSVQVKSTNDYKGKLRIRLKTTTLNYLFQRLEPVMIVFYNSRTAQAWWKWLRKEDFDSSKERASHAIDLLNHQNLGTINWNEILQDVNNIFERKNKSFYSREKEVPDDEVDSEKDYVDIFYAKEGLEKLPLLEQLYQALTACSDQMGFIPKDIFRRIFPLKIENRQYTYTDFTSDTLLTNNKLLFDLFASITIDGDKITFTKDEFVAGVRYAAKKFRTVVRILNHNQVFTLGNLGGGKDVKVYIPTRKVCTCARCLVDRLDFTGAYQQLKESPKDDTGELMKQAYVHFRFGNFSEAFRLYYRAYEKATKTSKHIQAFICLNNLKMLKGHINGYFLQVDNDVTALMKDLDKLSIGKAVRDSRKLPDFEKENIKAIAANTTFQGASLKIFETIEKIRQHYNSQLRGGWSNNSNVDSIVNYFDEIEKNFRHNFILYHPTELYEIFQPVMEGLLMSSRFYEGQGSRITYFKDFLLIWMIAYAKPEKLAEYFRRFSVDFLRYEAPTRKVWQIDSIVNKFFASYHQIAATYKSLVEGEGYFFRDVLQKTTLAVVIVASRLPLPKETDELIVKTVMSASNEETILHRTDMKYFADFLFYKWKSITTDTLKLITNTIIKTAGFHDETLFRGLSYAVRKKGRSCFIDDDATFADIQQYLIKPCPDCRQFHYTDHLIPIYDILTEHYQGIVKNEIRQILKDKFDLSIYYHFVMHDIIDYKEFYPSYLDYFEKVPKAILAIRSPFHSGIIELRRLNELINLTLKFNLQLNTPLFQSFKGLNLYYDWLLDMENFDYEKFKPEWLLAYPTSHYLKHAFSIDKLKKYVKKYLLKNKDIGIEQLYVEFV